MTSEDDWPVKMGRLPKGLMVVAIVITALYAASGRFLIAVSWSDLEPDSTTPEELSQDIAEGNTGPQSTGYPCQNYVKTIDLDIEIEGQLPIPDVGNVLMAVYISGGGNMHDRIYLGPPRHHISVKDIAFCHDLMREPDINEPYFWIYPHIGFYDLEGRRTIGLSGEQAYPIATWKDVVLNLHYTGKRLANDSFTKIVVRPKASNAPYPKALSFLQ